MKNFTFLSLVLMLWTIPVSAQDDPEDLAQKYFEVLGTEGFSSSGRFMHPEALQALKNMMLPVYELELSSGSRDLTNATFGESASYQDLADLDPVSFMNGFLNIISLQTGSQTLNFDKIEILGSIEEGSDIHVLARATIASGPVSITQMEVLSYRLYENSWRLLLNGEWRGMAEAIRASMLEQ